jgi:3',5'-cyclic AMP phosphodiesterase CpdA
MIDSILILHLSDLHFGPNSRFHDEDPKELGQKFHKALENERTKRKIAAKIALVIVTGDITEQAKSEQYKIAKNFFEILAQKLGIDHNRFIFVPGNHDVYWLACRRVGLDQEESDFSDEELRKRIDSVKFQNFKKFLEDFYDTPQNQNVVDLNYGGFIYNLDDLKLSVAGLNSSEIESHRKEDHRGLISKNQAQSLMDRWHGDKLDSWLKIVAIHHNPAPAVPESVREGISYLEKLEKEGTLKGDDVQRFASDAVGLEGRENLKRVAEDCGVQLILHGHHHASEQEVWPWHGQQSGLTHILSAGSWGLNDLPKNQPNNLQMILLNPEKKELHSWILVYDPRVRTEGTVALGNFTSDPANPDGYHQPLSLPMGFQLSEQQQLGEQNENQEDAKAKLEVAASPNIYYPKPYLLQKHFTGRVKYRQFLTEWLTQGNNPIFVLTGLSGSGKSALTWIWFQHDVLGLPINDLLPDPANAAEKLCVPENARPQGVIWWSFYDREARFSEFLEKSVCSLSEWTNNYGITSSKREQLEKLIDILYRYRFLVILDGFERELLDYSKFPANPEEAKTGENTKEDFRACSDRYAADFLKRVLAPNMSSRILITSQLFPKELEGIDHFPVSYCIHENLKDLTSDESVKFFNAQGVRGSSARIEAICSTYGNHSLTLRLLSGLISFHPERPGDITVAEEFNPILDPESRTFYILSKVYEAMRPEICELLCKISAFRSTTTYKKILILNSFQTEENLKVSIKELIERGLLQFDRDIGLYDLHPIIRKYAYEHLTDKVEVHSRLRDHFLDISKHNNSVPDKQKSSEELASIIELYYHTARMGLFDEAYRIFDKRLLYSLYFRFGAYFTIIELLTTLIPGVNSGNPGLKKGKDQMAVFNVLAIAYSRLGQSRLAEHYGNLAVVLADKLGEKRDRIINRSNLAGEQIRLGKLGDAERILRHRNEGKEDVFASEILHGRKGRLFAYEGDFTNASQELNFSLKLINKQNAKRQQFQSKCVYYAERAKLYLLRNMPEEALKLARQSIEFCLKQKKEGESVEFDFIRAEWLIGDSLVDLASHKKDRKNEYLDQAKIHLSESLVRCRNINLVVLEPAILLAWAKWHYETNDFQKSRNFAGDALNLADRCEYRLDQADIHNFLSQLALGSNDLKQAKEHAQIAYERAMCDGPPHCYKPALDNAKSILERLSQGAKT